MSMPTTVQGSSVPLAISLDDATYKNLVCATAHDLTYDTPVNTEQSDCGSHTSLGATTLQMTFSGFLNTTPNGVTEAGHDEVAGYCFNKTKVYLKTQPHTKVLKGYGWITNFVSSKVTDGLYSFQFTFTGDGAGTQS